MLTTVLFLFCSHPVEKASKTAGTAEPSPQAAFAETTASTTWAR